MPLDVSIRFPVDVLDVVNIAERAAKVILEIYESDDFGTESKADDSPITRADRAANELICSELARVAPHIPIVSEENRAVEYSTRQGYRYSWCVDPLDGTKEFVSRNGQFTVNIALLRGSRPVLGAVVVPATGESYWSSEGEGAWYRPSAAGTAISATANAGLQGGGGGGGAGGESVGLPERTSDAAGAPEDLDPRPPARRIRVRPFSSTDAGLQIVASLRHAGPDTQAFAAAFDSPVFSQMGSSLKLLLIAKGEADLYPRLAPTCEWDTAATHAIVSEAGGRVLQAGRCDGKTGRALESWRDKLAEAREVEYNKPDPLNPFFVVVGGCQDLGKLVRGGENGWGGVEDETGSEGAKDGGKL